MAAEKKEGGGRRRRRANSGLQPHGHHEVAVLIFRVAWPQIGGTLIILERNLNLSAFHHTREVEQKATLKCGARIYVAEKVDEPAPDAILALSTAHEFRPGNALIPQGLRAQYLRAEQDICRTVAGTTRTIG